MRAWPHLALVPFAIALTGCQTYEPRPLSIDDAARAFATRDPGGETARAFAARLSQNEGAPFAFDPSDGLTLAEAEPIALLFNRELRLARSEARVTRASAEYAGLWEDPVLGVDAERIVSGVPNPWVVAGTLGLTIPLSGRLAAEQAGADAQHAAQLQHVAAKEWALRSALRERWIEWSAQAERARLAAALVERLRALSSLTTRQEEAGVISRIDERVFRVELTAAEADAIAAEAALREMELQLRDLLGLTPAAPLRLIETVTFAPRASDPVSLRQTVENANPELAAWRHEYAAAEESLRAEIRGQYPDLGLSPGFGTDQGDERVLLGATLKLPVWNRNRRAIAEADARREAARARFEGGYEHLLSRLEIAIARHNAGRAVREAVEQRVLPLADEQDAEARRVAELGRIDPLLLLQAVRTQKETKERLLDARATEAVGAVRIDELLGPPAPAQTDRTPQQGGRP